MNLQRARYLVAVAKHLSFTRAAAELHIAQSALSQQIKVLERELDVVLFNRGGPQISLTAAGVVAVRESEYLITTADRSVERIRAAAIGAEGTLRIAHTRSWAGAVMARAIDEFRARHPRVEISERRGYTAQNVTALLDGSMDIAVVRPPIESPDLWTRPLAREELLLAVPSGHRLAGMVTVEPRELAGEPVVFWPRENGPGMHDEIVAILWPTGPPNVVRLEADDEQVLHAVASGVGIAPMPAGRASTYRVPGVQLCAVAGAPSNLKVGVAFRPDNPNTALRQFLQVLDDALAE